MNELQQDSITIISPNTITHLLQSSTDHSLFLLFRASLRSSALDFPARNRKAEIIARICCNVRCRLHVKRRRPGVRLVLHVLLKPD